MNACKSWNLLQIVDELHDEDLFLLYIMMSYKVAILNDFEFSIRIDSKDGVVSCTVMY